MQQILAFVIKNSHKLLFLLLLGISISLTIQAHSYHRSRVISSANAFTGGIYSQMNEIDEYFGLRSQNEALAKENARLKALLFNRVDSTGKPMFDSIRGVRKTEVLVAKVVHNTYNTQHNYITIDAGNRKGIRTDMGVINDLGIVGIVETTSTNYATVQSVLNIKSQINAKIKKSNHFGTLTWNGKNAGIVQLIEVPRLASIRKGDTIVTGGQSLIFPENIGIGTIDKYYTDDETNYYTIDVRLFNDMTNLGYVYIIKNKDRAEVQRLEAETKAKNE